MENGEMRVTPFHFGVVLVTVVFAASGCGSDASKGAADAKTPLPAKVKPAAVKLLKGKVLNGLLVPASALPKGYKLEADSVRNTGDAVQDAASQPVPAAKRCSLLVGTSFIRVAGIGEATFAQNDYADAGQTKEIAQEIDTYHGADATKVMKKLATVLTGCARFTTKENGMTPKYKIVTSRAANGNIKAIATSPTFEGGTTIVAIRVGNAVVTVLTSNTDLATGEAIALSTAKTIAKSVKLKQTA